MIDVGCPHCGSLDFGLVAHMIFKYPLAQKGLEIWVSFQYYLAAFSLTTNPQQKHFGALA